MILESFPTLIFLYFVKLWPEDHDDAMDDTYDNTKNKHYFDDMVFFLSLVLV